MSKKETTIIIKKDNPDPPLTREDFVRWGREGQKKTTHRFTSEEVLQIWEVRRKRKQRKN